MDFGCDDLCVRTWTWSGNCDSRQSGVLTCVDHVRSCRRILSCIFVACSLESFALDRRKGLSYSVRSRRDLTWCNRHQDANIRWTFVVRQRYGYSSLELTDVMVRSALKNRFRLVCGASGVIQSGLWIGTGAARHRVISCLEKCPFCLDTAAAAEYNRTVIRLAQRQRVYAFKC